MRRPKRTKATPRPKKSFAPYRNRFEKELASTLGPEYEYETIKLAYTLTKRYIPDFVDFANKRIVEGKGLWKADDRAKIKAIREQHPDWTIEMHFQNPNKTISPSSKTTYSDWCAKHGIIWKHATPSKTKQ